MVLRTLVTSKALLQALILISHLGKVSHYPNNMKHRKLSSSRSYLQVLTRLASISYHIDHMYTGSAVSFLFANKNTHPLMLLLGTGSKLNDWTDRNII